MEGDRRRRRPPALWKQISLRLEEEIAAGLYAESRKLPSENGLAERFQVHRQTVRKAIVALQRRGLLKGEQGRGSFVAEPVVRYPVAQRTRFSASLIAQRRAPLHELLTAREQAAGEKVASALGLPVGAPVLLLETLDRVDGSPTSVVGHYFPLPRFAGLAEAFDRSNSITAALAAFGVADFFRRSSLVSARLPSLRDASLLQLPRGRPILQIESVNVDPSGLPVEFDVARAAGDRLELLFDL